MTPDELKQLEQARLYLIKDLQRVSKQIRPTEDFAKRVISAAKLRGNLQAGWTERLLGHFHFTSLVGVRVAFAIVVLLAFLGAIPQYYRWIDSFWLGVSSNQIHQAKIQEMLWEKNFACATQLDQSADGYAAITNEHVVVVTWACPSGDVLVTLESPIDEASRRSVWIPIRRMHRSANLLDLIIPSANAAKHGSRLDKRSAQMVTVLCQKWLPNRFIKRRIKLADNRCVEEIINPRTGDVVQRQKSSCKSDC